LEGAEYERQRRTMIRLATKRRPGAANRGFRQP
jgi:hypothetical protein